MSTKQGRIQLKTYFETGDRPTEVQFIELIDSILVQTEDDIHGKMVGNVPYIGIGTPDPEEKLHVNGNTQVDANLQVKGDIFGDDHDFGRLNIHASKLGPDGGAYMHMIGSDTKQWGAPTIPDKNQGGISFVAAGNGVLNGFNFVHYNHNWHTDPNLHKGNPQKWDLSMRITGEGKVGIGTENPDAQVEIVGDSQNANDEGILRIESDAKKGDANLRFGVEKGSHSWIQAQGSKPLHINEVGNHTILNKGGGNVGIGTPNTDEKLTLKGSLSIHDGNIKGNESTGKFKMFANTNDFDGANVTMHGKDYGNATVRGAIGFIANNSHQTSWGGDGLAANEKAFTFSSNGGTDSKTGAGIWRSLLSIQKNGFIGINKYEPTNLLEINKSSGTDTGLKLTNGKGENKILASDGDGNATWVDKTSVTNGLWKKIGTS
ncbi:MAG: hypothetical protein MK066_13960, partial [Crocinitomicaceae bacterium]|nr:hypothetical protein [Crocinitomicaceae bacterium]